MPQTIDEFSKWRAVHQKEKVSAERRRFEILQQAAVKAEHLTGQPEWDYFLSLLQNAIDVTETQAKEFERKLSDPSLVGHEDLLAVKIDLIRCLERMMAWKVVMDLPKELVESGETAANILERLTDAGTEDTE